MWYDLICCVLQYTTVHIKRLAYKRLAYKRLAYKRLAYKLPNSDQL